MKRKCLASTLGVFLAAALVVLAAVPGPCHGAIIGQGWILQSSLGLTNAGAWGRYASAAWLNQYADTKFYYYQTRHYTFFAPVYVKVGTGWSVYANGSTKLRCAAYWLANTSFADAAMIDSWSKVTWIYPGRINVQLVWGADIGGQIWPSGNTFLASASGAGLTYRSVWIDPTMVTYNWNYTSYNAPQLARLGQRLCMATTSMTYWSVANLWRVYNSLSNEQKAYSLTFDAGLQCYAGFMAYRHANLASQYGGPYAVSITGYTDLQTKMISGSGPWRDWLSLGLFLLDSTKTYAQKMAETRSFYQLVAIGYYLTRWGNGADWSGASTYTPVFLWTIAEQIAQKGTAFQMIDAVEPVYGFPSMDAFQLGTSQSYRDYWGIETYTFISTL